MHLPSIAVNKSANMKSVKKTPLFFLVSMFLFIISKSSVSGSDADTKLPNYTRDKTKPRIPFRGSTHKLRINRAIIEKADEKLYQDQMNSEGIYDRKQIQNIESIFQPLAYETDDQMTNIFDSAEAKANMQAVFGYSTSELEQNNKSNSLNTADKGFINNSLLTARIADIFGPPPIDLTYNPHIKRNIHEKKYQGSLQAAIYNNFGPEVPNPSDTSDDDSKSTMEDDADTADNSGLNDRYPPLSEMEKKYAEDHKTTSTTQDSNPAQTPPHPRHISRSRPDLGIYLIPIYPDSSGSTTSKKYNSGNWASSPKTPDVPIPPPASSTAPSRNGASALEANSMLLCSCLYCFWLMAAAVASL